MYMICTSKQTGREKQKKKHPYTSRLLIKLAG